MASKKSIGIMTSSESGDTDRDVRDLEVSDKLPSLPFRAEQLRQGVLSDETSPS